MSNRAEIVEVATSGNLVLTPVFTDRDGLKVADKCVRLKITGADDFQLTTKYLRSLLDDIDSACPNSMGDLQEQRVAARLKAELFSIAGLMGCDSIIGDAAAYHSIAPCHEYPLGHEAEYTLFTDRGPNADELISSAAQNFANWLKPDRVIVWRILPEIDQQNGEIKYYFRCAQLP